MLSFSNHAVGTNQPDYATIIIHYSGNKLSINQVFEYLIDLKP